VIHQGRIPEPALRLRDDAVNSAVTKLLAPLQRPGNRPQEEIPISNGERRSGTHDGV
jgi:hypothetical protein